MSHKLQQVRVACAQILPPGEQGYDMLRELVDRVERRRRLEQQQRERDCMTSADIQRWLLEPLDENFAPVDLRYGVPLDTVLRAVGLPVSTGNRVLAARVLRDAGWGSRRVRAQRLWRPKRTRHSPEVSRGALRLVKSA